MNVRTLFFANFSFRPRILTSVKANTCIQVHRNISCSHNLQSADDQIVETNYEKDFREFDLQKGQVRRMGKMARRVRKLRWHKGMPPRYLKMSVDQDWTSVWPAAHSFKWSVVPLPVRQGHLKRKTTEAKGDSLPPEKYANAELMKIPNFLHLTPKHIKQHCDAIKKFCTPWPKELQTSADIKYHFPLEVVTSDYCFSSPSVRDPRARLVTMKFKLDDLKLDYHARDKFQRLIGSRYNSSTGEVTLVADRCPLKTQNSDYLKYLITALYFESWKVEAWEKEKTEADMERYFWDINRRRKNLVSLLNTYHSVDKAAEDPDKERQLAYLPEEITDDTVLSLDEVKEYTNAVEDIHNEGENYTTIQNYKQSVMKLLNIQTKEANPS